MLIGVTVSYTHLDVYKRQGYHIAYHTTWEYEKIDFEIEHDNFKSLEKISDVLPILLK